MTRKQQAHITAGIGTALFLLLLFLLLWFVYIGAPVSEEDEGIEIAFGEMNDQQSYASAFVSPDPTPLQATIAPVAPATPTHNDLMTQEDEESLALARQRKEEERLRREAEAERLRREQAAAEQKAREDAAIAKANQMGSLFGKPSGGSTGNETAQSGSKKGNPVPGQGTIGGNSWSLDGRSAKALPKPSNDFSQEGRVVVSIRVDADGNVVDAQITRGSTISDKKTQELALKAARQAKFSTADDGRVAIGTITYTFEYN